MPGDLPAETSRAGGDDRPGYETRTSLGHILRRDPGHLPEHLAGFAVTYHGTAALMSIQRRQAGNPEAPAEDLAGAVIEQAARRSRAGGATLGTPFAIIGAPVFLVLLMVQARMVLQIAGLAGRDPASPERSAELLVLQGAYRTTKEAAGALAAAGEPLAERAGQRLPPGTRLALVRRMAALLGVAGYPGPKPSWWHRAASVVMMTAFVAMGFVLPGIWVPVNAVAMDRATRRLGSRAAAYYGLSILPQAFPRQDGPHGARYAAVTAASFLPVVVPVLLVVAGLRALGNRWLAAGIVLAFLVLAGGVFWALRSRRAQGAAVEPAGRFPV